MKDYDVQMSEEAWRSKLSPDAYQVLRGKGTERAFTGTYWDKKQAGVYRCGACANPLFSSDNKYDSGSGWPSFWEALSRDKVVTEEDRTHGMLRVEVLCGACGSHLGHVFEDGPQPSGRRFCINSLSLSFEEEKNQ